MERDWGGCWLPTLNSLSIGLESNGRKTFGLVVSVLILCVDALNCNRSLGLNVLPEEVPLDKKVLGTVSNLLFGCQKEGTVVVLKHSCTDSGGRSRA